MTSNYVSKGKRLDNIRFLFYYTCSLNYYYKIRNFPTLRNNIQ